MTTGPIQVHYGVFRCSLPGELTAAAQARDWAAATLTHRLGLAPDTAETAKLLVSETVTNAVLHTASGRPGGSVTVELHPGPASVRIEVHDAGGAATAPRPVPAAPDAVHGRGLALVAALASEWGPLVHGRVRGVYFTLPAHTPREHR
ncbi:ATP-binding protein [Nocardiopsis sp. RSe5-2]|uniref:ATP-binding protein n=1 Tax=Nocardiopsis endophytica TaxID=3018445 RepID=A0ABT4UCR6_9ACTN|nr:ATP-binding protein [Nocardiopsis endophytica]MDA2814145.1 ATP-binding protein [Nocardiopsis endophytica]